MIPYKDFYKYYQTDFFKIQQIINKDALEKIDYWVEKFKDESESIDKNRVKQIIRSHIRITYLHCIDTLFELFFGLYPRNNKIQDINLPLIVGKNNDYFNKPRIEGLADKNEETIKELNEGITFGKQEVSLLQYIFYYQINQNIISDDKSLKDIRESLKPILDLLSIFAKDLADKSEYNSLKHALRVFPITGQFKLLDSNTKKEIAGIEFSNAHQYIQERKDDIKIVTKNFDSERDYRYTLIASKMIWNIINTRRLFFTKVSGVHSCYVYFFDENEFREYEESIIHKQKVELKLKKKNMP
ncbi:MAG: hypothetical protein ACOCP4_05735 [Candidatus Woesearchaeota archaeon]